MKESVSLEDANLNSLVDGELDSAESAALLEHLKNDPKLQRELCDIHRLKDMLKMAYPECPSSDKHVTDASKNWFGAIAASLLLLAIGFISGGLFYGESAQTPFQLSQVTADPQKLVLFVGYSDQEKFEATLDKAEGFLKKYQGENVRVDVVASGGGIDLLHKGRTGFLPRIQALTKAYDVLGFVACNNSIARMKQEGHSVEIIDEAIIYPSAVQFVVKRLREGWSYVAI